MQKIITGIYYEGLSPANSQQYKIDNGFRKEELDYTQKKLQSDMHEISRRVDAYHPMAYAPDVDKFSMSSLL